MQPQIEVNHFGVSETQTLTYTLSRDGDVVATRSFPDSSSTLTLPEIQQAGTYILEIEAPSGLREQVRIIVLEQRVRQDTARALSQSELVERSASNSSVRASAGLSDAQGTSFTRVAGETFARAEHSPEQAETTCVEKTLGKQRDLCLDLVAFKSMEGRYCNAIENDLLRGSCLMRSELLRAKIK